MSEEERKERGQLGRQHVMKNYNFENFEKSWIDLLLQIHENHGSWNTRKNYNSWKIQEV